MFLLLSIYGESIGESWSDNLNFLSYGELDPFAISSNSVSDNCGESIGEGGLLIYYT